MKILPFVVVLLMSVSTASAGGKVVLVFAGEHDNSRHSAVSLHQRADYACMTVMITSDEKEAVDRIRELGLARQAIAQEAMKNPKILVRNGPMSLSPESKSSLMKGSSYSMNSAATIHLLYSLADEKIDVFQAARELAEVAKSVKAGDDSSCRFSPIRLVVDTPEKYRAKMLEMIFDDLKRTRTLAKQSGNMELTGLENPVLVRQADDAHVELFLNYSSTMELPAE